MGKSKTPSFALNIPLVVSSQIDRELTARFNAAYRLYHNCLNEAEKRRKAMQADSNYAIANNMPKKVSSSVKGKQKDNPIRKKAFAELRAKYGYTEYALHSYATQSANSSIWIAEKLDANTSQKLATRAYNASSRVIFNKKTKSVRFKPFHQFKSVEGKSNKQGIRWKNDAVVWGNLTIPAILDPKNSYQVEALSDYSVKFVRIKRCELNGKTRYFAQLMLEGIAPAKRKKDGSFKHQTRDLDIGIDINVSNVAFVAADGSSSLEPFAEDVPTYDREIARLQRSMSRSIRVSNPDCFEPNFDKKKGRKVVRAKGKAIKGKRMIKRSKRYYKLAQQKRELQRKRSAYVKSQNRKLANKILSHGIHVKTEDVSIASWQKLWGKAILAKSPGYFQSELKRKAESAGGSFTKFSTYSTACSQTHLDGKKRKKTLSERVHRDVTGAVLHRDVFAAFLALQVENNLLPSVEELVKQFSAMESSLLQAWLDASCVEFIKDVKLKPLVNARLASIRYPQNVSASTIELSNR